MIFLTYIGVSIFVNLNSKLCFLAFLLFVSIIFQFEKKFKIFSVDYCVNLVLFWINAAFSNYTHLSCKEVHEQQMVVKKFRFRRQIKTKTIIEVGYSSLIIFILSLSCRMCQILDQLLAPLTISQRSLVLEKTHQRSIKAQCRCKISSEW